MRPIAVSAEREIFSNRFVRLYAVSAEFENQTKEYFVTERGARVGVLALRDGDVLLVRQYRFLLDDLSWELPGGGVAEGEQPVDAARRECREEAGIECRDLRPLFDYRQGVDVTKAGAFIFACRDFEASDELPANAETVEREWLPYSRALEMALDGTIADSMTIIALLAGDRLLSVAER